MKIYKKRIESRLDHLAGLTEEFKAFCLGSITDTALLYNLELCLYEALINAVKHAHKGHPEKYIDVTVHLDAEKILLKILHDSSTIPPSHFGNHLEFNPEDPATFPESGMGIFLMKRIMDEVSWNLTENKVELVMHKYLEPATRPEEERS